MIFKAPVGTSVFQARDGTIYRPSSDGTFSVTDPADISDAILAGYSPAADLTGVPTKSQALGYGLSGGTIVLAGDSITAFGDRSQDIDGDANRFLICTNALSPFHRANYHLGCPFTRVINSAASGGTTANMLSDFPTNVIAYNPDWVYIMCGVNDFVGVTSGASVASVKTIADAAWANILACVNLARDAGIKVILSIILPWRNSTDAATQYKRTMGTSIVNRYIRENAAKLSGVVLFDGAAAVQSYATMDNTLQGTPDTQYFDSLGTPIGVHLNSLGGQILEPILYNTLQKVLKPFIGRVGSYFDGTNGDPFNGLRNSALIGTTGTKSAVEPVPTGNVATSWDVSPLSAAFHASTTVACSKGTHWNPLYANVPTQVLTISNFPAVVDDFYDFSSNEYVALSQTLTLSGSQFAVGDSIFFEAEVDVTETTPGDAACTMLLLLFSASPGTAGVNIIAANVPGSGSSAGNPTLDADDLKGGKLTDSVIRTPAYVIPAGATVVRGVMVMRTKGAGSCVWKWARPQICKAVNV